MFHTARGPTGSVTLQLGHPLVYFGSFRAPDEKRHNSGAESLIERVDRRQDRRRLLAQVHRVLILAFVFSPKLLLAVAIVATIVFDL